jgi:hypothetical protein
MSLLDEGAESPRDRLVAVPTGVLIDQRGPGTRMTEPGHQLLEAGPGRRGQRSAHMTQIMKMQIRRTRLDSSCMPDRAKVGPAQLGALRPYEQSIGIFPDLAIHDRPGQRLSAQSRAVSLM